MRGEGKGRGRGRLAFAVGGNNLKAEKTAVVREEEEKRGRLLSAEDSPFSPPTRKAV